MTMEIRGIRYIAPEEAEDVAYATMCALEGALLRVMPDATPRERVLQSLLLCEMLVAGMKRALAVLEAEDG